MCPGVILRALSHPSAPFTPSKMAGFLFGNDSQRGLGRGVLTSQKITALATVSVSSGRGEPHTSEHVRMLSTCAAVDVAANLVRDDQVTALRSFLSENSSRKGVTIIWEVGLITLAEG